MARIRTIKPDFWTDEKIVDCSTSARLLFIGMWNFSDDYGNLKRSPKKLKMQVLPSDDVDCETLIQELMKQGVIVEYSAEGETYLHIKGFAEHQKVDKPTKSNIPMPEFASHSENSREDSRLIGKEGNGKEGMGEEINKRAEETETSPKKQKKLTQMPENWSPNDAHATKCRELGFDPVQLGGQFTNHHLSKASKFADWDRAFFTWIGNAENFRAKQTGRGGNQPATVSIAEAGLRVAARYQTSV